MSRLVLETATPSHAARLAPLMREADREEVKASMGWTAEEALASSLAASTEAWALLEEDTGEVLCLFGVRPIQLGTGAVWALTGTGVERHRASFFRLSKAVVRALSGACPVLRNYVDARHRRALRWLAALGFEVLPAVPFGVEGRLFHPVVLRCPRV